MISHILNKKFIFIIIILLLQCVFSNISRAEEKRTYEWFWLFYEKDINKNYEASVYRPFYLLHRTSESIFDASLMPIIFWRYRTDQRETWKSLFGFIQGDSYLHNKKEKDFDFGFFPLLFLGKSKNKKDRYFLLWPFGGTLKQKFGVEKISAYIFPGFMLFVFFPPSSVLSFKTLGFILLSMIPTYSSFEHKDYKGHALFWPLVQWGKGDMRRELRILPFFGWATKKGWYDRYSILMVFNYQRIYFKNDEHRIFFFLPIFGTKWSKSGNISSVTLLWPFFSWGYDKKTGDRRYNVPWPLVQIQDTRSPGIKKRIFFPFYGYYRYMRNKTIFVTPLYVRQIKRSSRFNSDYYINFLIFWYFKRDYHKKADDYYGNKWRYFKMWPIFQVEFNDLGDFDFNLLSLLPMRDPEGYEKMYQPFWSIIEYKKSRDGDKRLGLLFRLYYHNWGPGYHKVQMPFLFSFEKRDKKLKELHFLLYMFGYKQKKSGKYIRIFWIPIKIGEADQNDDNNSTGLVDEDEYHYSTYVKNGHIPHKMQFSCGFF